MEAALAILNLALAAAGASISDILQPRVDVGEELAEHRPEASFAQVFGRLDTRRLRVLVLYLWQLGNH
ncbi:hypothetical protein GCM10008090_15250 [Arenicella chitinivorans]|uniref:Uncharacterized protein n=2 Tax=Arenicella chitinivorans TaxID=1329800 RepID=A0A918VJG6_9GAMM|nr:hypothetical protein GCM10008090_15250 [Arenicella chitinivorans]